MGTDYSVIEAMSWRLASELFRRRPHALTLSITQPGEGMYDCISLRARTGPSSIDLNRVGSIHLLERFDGRGPAPWGPATWTDYLDADPREYLDRLETAAGLPKPSSTPASTPE